jgi:hypothetical protein
MDKDLNLKLLKKKKDRRKIPDTAWNNDFFELVLESTDNKCKNR